MEEKKIAYLHNWYVDMYEDYKVAHGNVRGHTRLMDTTFIHTSEVLDVNTNEKTGEVKIITRNTEYHSNVQDCKVDEVDKDAFPDIIELAKKLKKPREFNLSDNTIVLIISDHESYYFDTIVYKKDGKIYEGDMSPHIGMFQDSCLIRFYNTDEQPKELSRVDLRYFPHYKNLESYSWEHEDIPVYIENAGDDTIYFSTPEGLFEIQPGVRVLIDEKNAVKDSGNISLDGGDLYPALIIGTSDEEDANND